MFGDDQKRGETIASSFATAEIAPTASAGFPLQIYLTAGDLVRAFDRADFRPDAAIVPTNTELLTTGAWPATQRVLMERVRKQSTVMRDLEEQIAARKKQSPATSDGLMSIGVDTFVALLPRPGRAQTSGAFPKTVCLVATDFAAGGAIDRRELFAQDRVRKGIAGCLTALDAAGAQSLVLPLMGAATSGTQSKDAAFEGQRVLKECRLLNSVAGIALGIHDFAPSRRSLREIGVIQVPIRNSSRCSACPRAVESHRPLRTSFGHTRTRSSWRSAKGSTASRRRRPTSTAAATRSSARGDSTALGPGRLCLLLTTTGVEG